MGFNVGSRVIRATGGSISRQGNFVVHQFPPQHVTDGLVGFVDPQNHDCYDELRALTINDLSGAGIIGPGTLNGNFLSTGSDKNWKNDKGGYWRFDGNINANYSGNSTMPVLRDHTVEMWIKIIGSPSGGYHVFFQKDGGLVLKDLKYDDYHAETYTENTIQKIGKYQNEFDQILYFKNGNFYEADKLTFVTD